jgi:hypothetical protein
MMYGKHNGVYNILGRDILKKLLGLRSFFFFSDFLVHFDPKRLK